MNKDAVQGTGLVYSFTLRQMIKNKGNIISFAILAILLAASVPVMSLMSSSGSTAMIPEVIQSDFAMPDYYTSVMSIGKYLEPAENHFGTFIVQYGYSVLVMIVSMFSAIYIIRAVIEEKASKLVETLMVSVSPLALILGKILAVMTYIFSMFILLGIIYATSFIVSGIFIDTSYMGNMLAGAGVDFSALNISPVTIIIVLVSLALGYLTFSIIAGISGTSCSSMDEVERANMTVVLVVMAGYMAASFAPAFGSGAVPVIVSLVPILSIFCAPVHYVIGNVSAGILLLSWAIQAAVVVLLAMFCARVYRDLIMHSGGRVKLSRLIAIFRQKTAKEVE